MITGNDIALHSGTRSDECNVLVSPDGGRYPCKVNGFWVQVFKPEADPLCGERPWYQAKGYKRAKAVLAARLSSPYLRGKTGY